MSSSRLSRVKPIVLLVESHPLAAEYLRNRLREKNHVKVVSGEELLRNGDSAGPADAIFVLDAGALPYPIIRYVEHLRLHLERPRIIVLDRDSAPEEQLRLLSLGIRGMVSYRDAEKKMTAAIAEVASGGLWVAREILTEFVAFSKRVQAHTGAEALTRRECQILQLVQRRLSNKEISASLRVTQSTVKFHLANIFGKLGVRTRQSAVDMAEAASSRSPLLPVQSNVPAKDSRLPKLLITAKTA